MLPNELNEVKEEKDDDELLWFSNV